MVGLVVTMAAACVPSSPTSRSAPHARSCGPPFSTGAGWWACTFADNFDGRSLDRKTWTPQVHHGSGTTTAKACHVDSPETIAVEGGHLRLTVRAATTPVVCDGVPGGYVAGSVSTHRTFSQRYGRFEARVKVQPTTAPGLQEAFWLWPDDRVTSSVVWPAAGEIDIAETYSQYPTLAIPFLHYTANDNGGPRPGLNTAWNCPAARGVFNTYVLTWTPTTIRIDVNGRTCLTNTSGDPAFQKPYILAFTSALGIDSNALTPATPIPASMMVDYVRVWRWAPLGWLSSSS
jgi:beta-glucanase (GH16 family)